jgi:hypothetical protein
LGCGPQNYLQHPAYLLDEGVVCGVVVLKKVWFAGGWWLVKDFAAIM